MNTWLEINLAHLSHNLRVIRKRAQFAKEIIAVVKTNAYGHGLELITKKLYQSRVRWFAVADIDEAEKISFVQPQGKIIILRSLFKNEIGKAIKNRWRFLISSLQDAKEADFFASQQKNKAFIHWKIDTGLSRLGSLDHNQILNFIKNSQNLNLEGVCSHYAAAGSDKNFSLEQKRRFEKIQKIFPPVELIHMINSAALFQRELHLGNAVRVGASLYGFSPFPQKTASNLDLMPVMSWKTHLLLIKKLPANISVGYGRTFKTKKSQKIGILPLGYSQGLNIRLSNLGKLLIQGKFHSIAGRIAMNLTAVALHDSLKYKKGDEVVILGKQKTNSITLESQANLLQTIPYEICATIPQNIKRIPK